MSQGGIVWITGIPASGKSTLAGLLAKKVVMRGGKAEILDGDDIRQTISKGLGFDRESRRENARRMSWIARKLAKNDIWAFVAAVSPYKEDREEAKKAASDEGLYFMEVQLKCSLTTAQLRDPKGLYKKAKEGSVKGVTGLDAPYEISDTAFNIDTTSDSAEEAASRVWDVLIWRPEDVPPMICIGRGYGGTRLVSKLMQDMGVFIGQNEKINGCEDSLDWVPLIYKMLEECGPNSDFADENKYKDSIRNTGRLILKGSNEPPGSPWGWKLPETTFFVSMFASAFPKSKFIHCVRHPVSASLRNVHSTATPEKRMGKASLLSAYAHCKKDPGLIATDPDWLRMAITWEHQTSLAMTSGRKLGDGRYYEVKYEDVCASPDWAYGALERFLNIRRLRRRSSVEVMPERMNKWDVSDPRAPQIWEICGKTAQAIGYSFLEGYDPETMKKS